MGLLINRLSEYRLGDVLAQMKLDRSDLDWHRRAGADRRSGAAGTRLRAASPHGEWESASASYRALSVTTSRDILVAMAAGEGPQDALIALGYSGWSAGQLGTGTAGQRWLTAAANERVVFHTPLEERWSAAAGLVGVDPLQLPVTRATRERLADRRHGRKRMSCVLGFDVGSKLIGVAIGNTIAASARALAVIPVREAARTGRNWTPCTNDGSPTRWSSACRWRWMAPCNRHPLARRFAEHLRERYQAPVALVDEQHSSQEAAQRCAQARAAGTKRRSDAANIDAEAAAEILERWLAAAPAAH